MTIRLATLLLLLFSDLALAETRTFIDQSGRPLEGELVSASGDMVAIKRKSDGKTLTMKATNFSKSDQAYFAKNGGSSPAPVAPTTAGPTSESPMRIEVKVYPNKSQKNRNGYSDYKNESIGYRVDIRNGEQARSFKGGKATIMAFAENLQDRSESKVLLREDFDVDLERLSTSTRDTKEAKLTFDNIGYKYGFKYSGFILVVKDATGKTVNVTASSATVAKFAEDILKLKESNRIDKNYKVVN
jgi:hypothetical protein